MGGRGSKGTTESSADEAFQIFRQSLDQPLNHLWFKENSGFLPTKNTRKCNVRKKDRDKAQLFQWIHCDCIKCNWSSVINQEMAGKAQQKYKAVAGNEVLLCGLSVKPVRVRLAAFPDGAVFESNRPTLLEVKCPSSHEKKAIDVKYLADGKLKNSAFYTKVRLQI